MAAQYGPTRTKARGKIRRKERARGEKKNAKVSITYAFTGYSTRPCSLIKNNLRPSLERKPGTSWSLKLLGSTKNSSASSNETISARNALSKITKGLSKNEAKTDTKNHTMNVMKSH